MAKKIKTEEEIKKDSAYSAKKKLREISISLSFLDNIFILKRENKIHLIGQKKEYFIFDIIDNEVDSYLFSLIENEECFLFEINEDFLKVKNGLKKDFQEIKREDEKIILTLSSGEFFIKKCALPENIRKTICCYRIFNKEIEINELKESSFVFFNSENERIIEIPKSEISLYSGGPISLFSQKISDEIILCKLEFQQKNFLINQYLKTIK